MVLIVKSGRMGQKYVYLAPRTSLLPLTSLLFSFRIVNVLAVLCLRSEEGPAVSGLCALLPLCSGDPNWIRLARCSNCGLSFHRKIRRLENTGAAESQVVDAVKSFISKRRAYTLAKSSGADDERQVAPGSSNTSPALSVAMDEDGSSRSASPSTPRSPQLGQVHAYQPISFARHPSPPLSSAAHALYPSPPTTYYPSPASSNYPSTSTSSSERASHAEDAFIRPGHTSPTFETSFTRYQHPYPSKEHPFRFPAFQATSGLAKGQRG